jgi:hypothetical protein
VIDVSCQYTIKWKDVCKAVSQEKVDLFNDKFNNIELVLKLTGKHIELQDLFFYFLDSSESKLESELDDLGEIVEEIKSLFNEILVEFRKETEINIGVEINYDLVDDFNQVDFLLDWHDMMQLTPKA